VKKLSAGWLLLKFAILCCITCLLWVNHANAINARYAKTNNCIVAALNHVPDFLSVPVNSPISGSSTIGTVDKNTTHGYLDFTQITQLNQWFKFSASIFYTGNLNTVCKMDIIYPFHYFW